MLTDPAEPLELEKVFALDPHGTDVWVGESPEYSWGRIYGGCVVAQALWAATQTVDVEHSIHSMHAYFILGGDPAEPVRYEVDRIRNGRSFTTRRVVARQSSGAILNLSASFQRYEEGMESQISEFPSDVVPVADGEAIIDGAGVDRIISPVGDQARSLSWLRFPMELDDPRLNACALAYMSDAAPMGAIAASHPQAASAAEVAEEYDIMAASLDHAMWFHRPVKATDWALFDMGGHGFLRTRGLATGEVFTESGVHVATVAQEGLIRARKKA